MLESMSTKDSARNVLWGAGIAAALSLVTTGLVVYDFAGRRSYERNPTYIQGVVCAESVAYPGNSCSFDVNSVRGTTSFYLPIKDNMESLTCDALINKGDEIKIKLKYWQDPSKGSQTISLDQIVSSSK